MGNLKLWVEQMGKARQGVLVLLNDTKKIWEGKWFNNLNNKFRKILVNDKCSSAITVDASVTVRGEKFLEILKWCIGCSEVKIK